MFDQIYREILSKVITSNRFAIVIFLMINLIIFIGIINTSISLFCGDLVKFKII
jgi:hypothetical protein